MAELLHCNNVPELITDIEKSNKLKYSNKVCILGEGLSWRKGRDKVMQEQDGFSVCILCGGRSLRMGRDKAMLDWFGKPLIQHLTDVFSSCDDLFLSVRDDEQLKDINIRKVIDKVSGYGPMAGLQAALNGAVHDILFVTTCDAPMVDMETARMLMNALEGHDAVVPEDENGIHPLIAVYRKTVVAEVTECMKLGEQKMTGLLGSLDVCRFPAEDFPYGELTLSNLNTAQDLDNFRKRQFLRPIAD